MINNAAATPNGAVNDSAQLVKKSHRLVSGMLLPAGKTFGRLEISPQHFSDSHHSPLSPTRLLAKKPNLFLRD